MCQETLWGGGVAKFKPATHKPYAKYRSLDLSGTSVVPPVKWGDNITSLGFANIK